MNNESPRIDPYWFHPAPSMTAGEAAEKAGISVDAAVRLWRALGLPEVDDDTVAFNERDVEVLRMTMAVAESGIPLDELVTMSRVYGKAASMVADAEVRSFQRNVLKPLLEVTDDQEVLRERIEAPTNWLLETSAAILDYARRQHLDRALEMLGGAEAGEEITLAVGFVDLVDFSRLTDDLSGLELSGLVESFEELVISLCASHDVHVVKIIGDAVMFVSPDSRRLVDAGTAIVRAVDEHEALPVARAGADRGRVVSVGGDYFGRPVNVASRITGFAKPRTVVVSRALLDSVEDASLDAAKLRQHNLKGVGRSSCSRCGTNRRRRTLSERGSAPSLLSRRRGRRRAHRAARTRACRC